MKNDKAANAGMSRESLLALTPQRYLSGGFRDERGLARRELQTTWALAAAQQLRAAGVTAKALQPAVDSLAKAALEASPTASITAHLATLERAIAGSGAPPPAKEMLLACVRAVREQADLVPLAQHAGAIVRLLALDEAALAADGLMGPPPASK